MFTLSKLNYGYGDLVPYISEEQLKLHHTKHHQAYVDGTNKVLEKLEQARKDNVDLDQKAVLKELSFHLSGHRLHSLFWKNLTPEKESFQQARTIFEKDKTKLSQMIKRDFESFERFKLEFSQAALTVEGSGWTVLVYEREMNKILVMQIEKHNLNYFTNVDIILVLDVWEHAYYLDYKNDRKKYIEGFWNIIDWEEVEKRL